MLNQRIVAWDGHIVLEPAGREIVVSRNGREVARSTGAILLTEGGGSPTLYVPREDLDATSFTESTLTTGCPWKGEAHYLSYRGPSDEINDVAWYYPEPKAPVMAIAGHVASYPNRFDIS